MKRSTALLIFILSLCLSGCAGTTAFGRKEDYSKAWPSVRIDTTKRISVSVIDIRPYTKTNKPKQFVGLMRGGYGNSFDITTESQLPLSNDLEHAIISGMLNSGIDAYVAEVTPSFIFKSQNGNERLLIVKLSEWKSDTYNTTRFIYDISADVYNENGLILGSASVGESEAVPSAIEAGRQALNALLAEGEIRKSLSD